MIKRKYTCIPDQRSRERLTMARYHFSKSAKKTPASKYINVSHWTTHNQEEESSCTGYALSTLREHYEIIKNNVVQLSPLFIYWWERKMIDMVFEDGGARIGDGMEVLKGLGVCEESYHKSIPGTSKDVFVKPDTKAMVSALKYRISEYTGVPNLDHLLIALASLNPVVIGIPVYESMQARSVNKTGIIPLPKKNEELLGGHAVVACGYDKKKKLVKFHNSWGIKWGDSGYGYAPFEYLKPGTSIGFWGGWEIKSV